MLSVFCHTVTELHQYTLNTLALLAGFDAVLRASYQIKKVSVLVSFTRTRLVIRMLVMK